MTAGQHDLTIRHQMLTESTRTESLSFTEPHKQLTAA